MPIPLTTLTVLTLSIPQIGPALLTLPIRLSSPIVLTPPTSQIEQIESTPPTLPIPLTMPSLLTPLTSQIEKNGTTLPTSQIEKIEQIESILTIGHRERVSHEIARRIQHLRQQLIGLRTQIVGHGLVGLLKDVRHMLVMP